jgi:hypothetical protein
VRVAHSAAQVTVSNMTKAITIVTTVSFVRTGMVIVVRLGMVIVVRTVGMVIVVRTGDGDSC